MAVTQGAGGLAPVTLHPPRTCQDTRPATQAWSLSAPITKFAQEPIRMAANTRLGRGRLPLNPTAAPSTAAPDARVPVSEPPGSLEPARFAQRPPRRWRKRPERGRPRDERGDWHRPRAGSTAPGPQHPRAPSRHHPRPHRSRVRTRILARRAGQRRTWKVLRVLVGGPCVPSIGHGRLYRRHHRRSRARNHICSQWLVDAA